MKNLFVNNGKLELREGLIFKVNYFSSHMKPVTDFFKVADTEADDNCGGTIKLQVLAHIDEYGKKTFENRFSIVEELWFNTEETGRIIKVVTEEEVKSAK